MRKYHVYGDYGFTSQVRLGSFQRANEATALAEATEWAQHLCDAENACDHDIIEVAWTADDGEYIVEWVWRREQEDAA